METAPNLLFLRTSCLDENPAERWPLIEDQICLYYMLQYISLTAAYLINLCEN